MRWDELGRGGIAAEEEEEEEEEEKEEENARGGVGRSGTDLLCMVVFFKNYLRYLPIVLDTKVVRWLYAAGVLGSGQRMHVSRRTTDGGGKKEKEKKKERKKEKRTRHEDSKHT